MPISIATCISRTIGTISVLASGTCARTVMITYASSNLTYTT